VVSATSTTKALLAVCAALASSGCHKEPELTRDALQREALIACKCQQSRKSETGCWSKFEHSLPVDAESMVSMCDPISTENLCWSDHGERQCITTRSFAALTKPPSVLLCTNAEVSLAQKILSRTFDQSPIEVRRAEKMVRALPRNIPSLESSKTPCG
jgi:hypothetical protein